MALKLRRPLCALVVAALLAPALFTQRQAEAASAITFAGGGWGHGIGLSQWGSKGQADAGRSYDQILGHYYQSTGLGTAAMPGEVRVGLLWDTGQVRITANGPFDIRHGSPGGELLAVGGADQVWTVTTDGAGNFNLAGPAGQSIQRSGGSTALYVVYANYGSLLRLPQTGNRYKYGVLELNTYNTSGPWLVRALVAGMNMQQYLYGLGEVPSSWPVHALRAQAVAGRTYAADKIRRLGPSRLPCNCSLYATTIDQAYVGYEKEAGSFAANWVAAVDATNAQVVLYAGQPIEAYYSSSSGGHTEHNENVWGGTARAYLRGVPDPWDSVSPHFTWNVTYSIEDLQNRLNSFGDTSIGSLQSIETLAPYGVSGRVLHVIDANHGGVRIRGTAATRRISGTRLREVLGLKTTLFKIIGSSSTHPNGTLIKGSGPAVYRVEAGRILPLPSPGALESWGGWDEVISVGDDEVLRYRGANQGFRDGTLIRTPDGTVWIISGGARRGFTSAEVFTGLGYSWANVMDVSQEEANLHPQGVPVASVAQHPDGSLLKGSGATVWWIQGGRKRPIPSEGVLVSWFRWAEVVTTTDARINAYSDGAVLGYRDGKLIRTPEGTVWVIADQARRGFTNQNAFNGLGFNWGNVINVQWGEAGWQPEGPPVTSASEAHPNGTLLRGSIPNRFVVRGGIRYHVLTDAVFSSWSFQPGEVVTQSNARVAGYSPGNPPKGYRDGSLVRTPDGTVWLISDALRKGFTSASVFTGLGFSWSSVRDVVWGEAALHPEGPVISSSSKHPDGSIIKSGGPAVYWMDNGSKRGMPTPGVFTSWFGWWEVATTDDAHLNSYSTGPALGYRDGSLFRTPDGTVWVVSDGLRRGVTSGFTFSALGYSWANVRDVTFAEASLHPVGEPLS